MLAFVLAAAWPLLLAISGHRIGHCTGNYICYVLIIVLAVEVTIVLTVAEFETFNATDCAFNRVALPTPGRRQSSRGGAAQGCADFPSLKRQFASESMQNAAFCL